MKEKQKVVYRVTLRRGSSVHMRHFFTKRAADRYAEKHRTGYYVEAYSFEESGYRVPPADEVTVDVSAPLVFP